jgi:hypothetical protein
MGLTRPTAAQLNTIVTSISDPITVLNRGSTLANIDIGFVMNRDGGTRANTAIYWSESGNTFVTAFTTSSGLTNANITVAEYANLKVNSLFGNIGGGTTLANIFVTGSFLPSANAAYDLGSSTLRWRTGYFTAGTIDLGGSTIGVGAAGFTFTVAGGSTITLSANSAISANTLLAPTVTFTGGTPSTNTTSGTIVVTGGIGASGNLSVGSVYTNNYFYANGVSLLSDLYANAGAQSGSIATLTSNAAVQAGDIAT